MNDAVSTIDIEAAPAQFGRQLAAARESCGLSIAEVARQLRLSPMQVEAMEAGDFQRLPGPVFARGFVRNYARLVKLDPRVLRASEDQRLYPAVPGEPEFLHSVNIPFPTGRETNWRKYGIAAAVVLVLLVPIVILDIYREDTTGVIVKTGPGALPPSPTVEPPQETAASAVPQIAAAGDVVAEPALTTNAAALPEKPAVEGSTLSANAMAIERKPGEHLLKLTFDRQAWVEIHDRSGRRIFSKLNAAGTEQAVTGETPLMLVVGNARGVRLTHNGQPVDLAPYTSVDVARLTLE